MVVDGSGTYSYGYDAISQLADVNYPTAASTAYTYDELGNRTDVNEGSSVSYVSNNLNQYSTVGGVNYSYDDNGNLVDVNSGAYLYSYDCENRLVGANTPDANFVYGYDYKGRRVWSSDGSAAVNYCVDGDQVIAEYDGNDSLLRKFVYGAGIDEPLIMVDVADNNAVYYYHFDGLGSVVALSDANSDVAEAYSYDVFGEPNRTSDINNPYMFTARRYDADSGLYYYRTRYYAADIGRFLQPDTIGYKDGMNMYAYVHNNPVMNTDAYGLACSGTNCQIGYKKSCCDGRISEVHAFKGFWIFKKQILLGWRAKRQKTRCNCQSCCDDMDILFKKKVGGHKWILGHMTRYTVCISNCNVTNKPFYYY